MLCPTHISITVTCFWCSCCCQCFLLPFWHSVLDEGPDVIFAVTDLDPTDDTIEVLSTEFFTRKVGLRSIRIGPKPEIVFSRPIDENCGAPFSAILADLDGNQETTHRVIDSGSTVMTTKPGDSFSHLLVTSQYCSTTDQHEVRRSSPFLSINDNPRNGLDDLSYNPNRRWTKDGGSLFAYRVPSNWKTGSWHRSAIASGFGVRQKLQNMINPGAPGFVYTFFAQKHDGKERKQRPMIAVAGDCSESAYILRPEDDDLNDKNVNEADDDDHPDPNTRYRLLCEIETGATVGSIGIGYHPFNGKADNGFAKLYLPLFEKNKMLVFALGSGSDDNEHDRNN